MSNVLALRANIYLDTFLFTIVYYHTQENVSKTRSQRLSTQYPPQFQRVSRIKCSGDGQLAASDISNSGIHQMM